MRHIISRASRSTIPSGRLAQSTSALSARPLHTRPDPKIEGTFSLQSSLPRLPIPDLEDTATRYLRSLEPLLSADEFKQSKQAVADFVSPTGLGPVLQARLHAVDKAAPHSWLEDMWLQKAYLEWRGPSYLNVNWGAIIGDNPDSPPIPASAVEPGRITDAQVSRAARMITHMLASNEALNNQSMPVDKSRAGPLCMEQFKWQFGTTRIPDFPGDRLVHQYPSTAQHILVMYRDHCVSVPVYGSGRANTAQIEEQLRLAARSVDDLIAANGAQAPVANLTAADRDSWATARQSLARDAGNAASLAAIESALFTVCLDVDVDAASLDDLNANWHTFAHGNSGGNRWFDKAISLVFLPTGRMGANCEHSPVDALTTGRLILECLARERGASPSDPATSGLAPPTPLRWNVGQDVADQIRTTQKAAGDLAADLGMQMAGAPVGAKWIKSLGVSPDAFFQVALQAAHLRHHGALVPTYESASLRRFLHGRTETIRSASSDALAFAKSLDDKAVPLATKLELFRRAAATHTALTAAATQGEGVDRHLLGLRVQLQPDEANRATLFTDPAYAYSTSFILSTSNTTPGDQFRGGFAPVAADGYGINYAIDPKDIKFSVSEWRSSPKSNPESFMGTVKTTLEDLKKAGEQVLDGTK